MVSHNLMTGLNHNPDYRVNPFYRPELAVQVHSILSRANFDALLSDESVFLVAVQLRLEGCGQLEAHGLGCGDRNWLA